MSHIDPVMRMAAIAALKRLHRMGPVTAKHLTEMAKLYEINRYTLESWNRRLVRDQDPTVDLRQRTRRERLDDEILGLIAHYGSLKGAYQEAMRLGIFTKSYAQFTRDFCADFEPAVRHGVLVGRHGLVANQPIMSYPKVGRNQVWVMDHSQSNVRVVMPDCRAGRPWVSLLRDKGSGLVLGVAVLERRANSASTIAIVATAMVDHTPTPADPPIVAGRPESILCDNGGENTSNVLVEGFARLGIAVLPTTPGHSWQNGSAENIIGVYQQQCEKPLPGYVHGGKGVDGQLRYVAGSYEGQDVDALLSFEELQVRATAWALTYNTSPGRDGLSPIERWLADAPDPESDPDPVAVDEVRWAMTVASRRYTVTKNGIHFNNREYQGAALAPFIGAGKVITVRYFPGTPDWIEAWHDDTFIARVFWKTTLPVSEQSRIHALRRRETQQVARAEAASVQRRQQDAHESLTRELLATVDDADPPEVFGVRGAKPIRDRSGRAGPGFTKSRREEEAVRSAQDRLRRRFRPLPLNPGEDE